MQRSDEECKRGACGRRSLLESPAPLRTANGRLIKACSDICVSDVNPVPPTPCACARHTQAKRHTYFRRDLVCNGDSATRRRGGGNSGLRCCTPQENTTLYTSPWPAAKGAVALAAATLKSATATEGAKMLLRHAPVQIRHGGKPASQTTTSTSVPT